jgi:hypothetical protein
MKLHKTEKNGEKTNREKSYECTVSVSGAGRWGRGGGRGTSEESLTARQATTILSFPRLTVGTLTKRPVS